MSLSKEHSITYCSFLVARVIDTGKRSSGPSWLACKNGYADFLGLDVFGLGCFELNPVTKRLFSMS